MATSSQICRTLEELGLLKCAFFVAEHTQDLDPNRFLEILNSPGHFVNIPLTCIYWDLNIIPNEATTAQTEELLKIIDAFSKEKKHDDKTLGGLLDQIFGCHLLHRTLRSIQDLLCLFAIFLTSDDYKWVLEVLEKNGSGAFWSLVFNNWMSKFGVSSLSSTVVDIFRSGDIVQLKEIFSHSNGNEIKEFLEDLDQIQESVYDLSESDWQWILKKGAEEEGRALAVLHSAVLGKSFLNWLIGFHEEECLMDLPMDIASVVMTLVQEKKWRFADVSKLFRFSKEQRDLPGLLAALRQIHEGNLPSSELDSLPDSMFVEEVDEMVENRMEFQPAMEISREEAIRHIVNSEFNRYGHETAKITEAELNRLMTIFDSAYKGEGGEFAKEAKAIHAVEDFFKMKMRDVQILGVLLATQARRANVARLLQMQTGEGKTYVIAAIAIVEVFNGRKVDIITSSDTLAVSQCDELRTLYEKIGIKVQHNCTEDRTAKEESKVYEADIVYGNASHFMFDVLFEEFWGSTVRCNRGFPLAIIDEVDSQMLDHANHVCRFASSASGMGNLFAIQATVWMLVSQNFKDVKYEDGYWIVSSEEGEVVIQDVETLKQYFRDGLLEIVEKAGGFISGAKDSEKIDIPKTLWKYSEKELPLWIDSAVEALLKKPNFDYCIENDNIVIVDSGRSGARNRGKRWAFGLHQFLEMLHATKLSPESLSMCFISTMSFIRRYKTNIIGLTGTIGGEASRKFLRDVYNVDFVEIPPFMQWRHINLPHIFCENTESWLETVVTKVVNKLSQGRACLVITQYIHFAEVICREIRERIDGRIGTYTGGEDDIDVNEIMTPGTCIVATNIAGRGTDLKISDEVENVGGLHVVLTSLPENDRVERQNIGRSSRIGQRGTSQMILDWTQVDEYFLEEMLRRVGKGASHTLFINTLKEIRDDWALRNVDVWIKEMEGIQKSDEALSEFIQHRNALVNSLHYYEEKNRRELEEGLNIRFGIYMATTKSSLDPEAVKRDFADLKGITMQNLENCFADYVYPALVAFTGEWNPERDWSGFERVLKLLGKSIDLDRNFAGAAFYMRGYAYLIKYRTFETNIWDAIVEFDWSRKVVKRLLEQYKLLMVTTKRKGEAKTKLEAQLDRMIIICGVILANINTMIGIRVSDEIDTLYRLMTELRKQGKDVSEVQKSIKSMEDNRKELEMGVVRDIGNNGAEIEIKEQRLVDMLPDNVDKSQFAEEIDYFEKEGYVRFITVKKREKIRWWNVAGVALLGVLQMVGGAMLTFFTAGITMGWGIGLIVSGVTDIYTAIKSGIIDRDFDWKAYGMDKIFDVVTCVMTAGFTGLRVAARGLATGVKAITKITTTQVAKETLKLGTKQVVKKVTLGAAKITANEVFTRTIAPKIKDKLANILTEEIARALKPVLKNNENLHNLVEKDNSNKNRTYTSRFVKKAYDNFEKRLSPSDLAGLRKSLGDGVTGQLERKELDGIANALKTGIEVGEIAKVALKLMLNLQFLKELLVEMAGDSKGGATGIHENRVYEKEGTLSVDSVIKDLAFRISKFCVRKPQNDNIHDIIFASNNIFIDKTCKKINKDAGSAIKTSDDKCQKTKKEGGEIGSSDSLERHLDAKYLAQVVLSPIEIEHKSTNGTSTVVVYGKEITNASTIRMKYEEEKGLYFFDNGSAASLVEAVSEITDWDIVDLKHCLDNHKQKDHPQDEAASSISRSVARIFGGVRNDDEKRTEDHTEYHQKKEAETHKPSEATEPSEPTSEDPRRGIEVHQKTEATTEDQQNMEVEVLPSSEPPSTVNENLGEEIII